MPSAAIEIKNSDVDDNFVTIKDRNLAGSPVVWNQKRLNAGLSENCNLELDGSGEAKVNWTATRVDDSSQTKIRDDEAFPNANPIFISSL